MVTLLRSITRGKIIPWGCFSFWNVLDWRDFQDVQISRCLGVFVFIVNTAVIIIIMKFVNLIVWITQTYTDILK